MESIKLYDQDSNKYFIQVYPVGKYHYKLDLYDSVARIDDWGITSVYGIDSMIEEVRENNGLSYVQRAIVYDIKEVIEERLLLEKKFND